MNNTPQHTSQSERTGTASMHLPQVAQPATPPQPAQAEHRAAMLAALTDMVADIPLSAWDDSLADLAEDEV